MEITKEQILKIVDQCFHYYASSFRQDAKEKAFDLIDKHESEQLTLTDVVSSKRFEEKDLLIAYQNGYIENGCIDYVLNFDERMDLLKNAEKWTKSYKK